MFVVTKSGDSGLEELVSDEMFEHRAREIAERRSRAELEKTFRVYRLVEVAAYSSEIVTTKNERDKQ